MIASLLTRERLPSLHQVDTGEGPTGSGGKEMPESTPDYATQDYATQDPEQSLMALGSASLRPTGLSAASQVTVLPEIYGLLSPKESLHALGMSICNYML